VRRGGRRRRRRGTRKKAHAAKINPQAMANLMRRRRDGREIRLETLITALCFLRTPRW